MILKDIKIIDIIQDGRGVGRTDTKTVFVENAVYGETLDAKVKDEKKNFFEAIKIDTKINSNEEIKPPCPYFYECGGCSIMNINYETQIKLKKNLIINAIAKSTGIKLPDIEIIESIPFRYRNKIRLQVDSKGNLNYLKAYSDDLVEIEGCLIANDIISENLLEIRDITRDINNKFETVLKEITIRANDEKILLVLSGNFDEKIIKYLADNYKDSKYQITILTKPNINISGNGYLDYKIFDKTFRISANDFYQVNDYQIENLYRTAREFLGEDKKILDLFCGSGVSSISINDDHIIGIEINKSAIEDANFNAKINGLKDYKFIAKNAKYIDHKFIKENKIDAVTVDPPRAGLDKEIIKTIANANIAEIVYISCNPQTLARDIKRFMDRGYELKKIKAVDMFPETMHVETVVLMSRE